MVYDVRMSPTVVDAVELEPYVVEVLVDVFEAEGDKIKPETLLLDIGCEDFADIAMVIYYLRQKFCHRFEIDAQPLMDCLDAGYRSPAADKFDCSEASVMESPPVFPEIVVSDRATEIEEQAAQAAWGHTIARSIGRLQAFINKLKEEVS